MPNIVVPLPYNLQRSGTIPTNYTDLLLTTAPADGVIRKDGYNYNQIYANLYLGTVGGGVKIQCLVSTNRGTTWVKCFETVSGLLIPEAFFNKVCGFDIETGGVLDSNNGDWYRIQIASLSSASPAANAVMSALAKCDVPY